MKLVVRALLLLAVSLAHLNPFALAEAGRTQLSASWEWSASPSELRRAPSVYDVQSIALVEVCATDGAVAGRKQPGDLSEWSALPSAEPEGASTTPSVCVGATNTADDIARSITRPSGVADDWISEVAANGKGTVWRAPGTSGNAGTVRIMEPTAQYPNGYVRFYNQHGQPIGLNGNPGPNSVTHIPLNPDGTYTLPKGWGGAG